MVLLAVMKCAVFELVVALALLSMKSGVDVAAGMCYELL